MQNYIDNCKKESGKHAVYPDQSNVHFENFENITIDSDSITPREKKNRSEENIQEYHKIPYDKIEVNQSIEKNASKKLNKK